MFKRKARKIVKCWFKSWRYQPRWSLNGFVMRYLEMGEQQAEHIRIPTFPHIVTALLWGKPMKYGINPESRYWLSVCKWEASNEGALRRLWIWENIFFWLHSKHPKKVKKAWAKPPAWGLNPLLCLNFRKYLFWCNSPKPRTDVRGFMLLIRCVLRSRGSWAKYQMLWCVWLDACIHAYKYYDSHKQ